MKEWLSLSLFLPFPWGKLFYLLLISCTSVKKKVESNKKFKRKKERNLRPLYKFLNFKHFLWGILFRGQWWGKCEAHGCRTNREVQGCSLAPLHLIRGVGEGGRTRLSSEGTRSSPRWERPPGNPPWWVPSWKKRGYNAIKKQQPCLLPSSWWLRKRS